MPSDCTLYRWDCNVWCIKNCTKHSSKTLLRLVQFLMHKTLPSHVVIRLNWLLRCPPWGCQVGRSVNPISTRGWGRFCQSNNSGTPDFQTFLWPCDRLIYDSLIKPLQIRPSTTNAYQNWWMGPAWQDIVIEMIEYVSAIFISIILQYSYQKYPSILCLS